MPNTIIEPKLTTELMSMEELTRRFQQLQEDVLKASYPESLLDELKKRHREELARMSAEFELEMSRWSRKAFLFVFIGMFSGWYLRSVVSYFFGS